MDLKAEPPAGGADQVERLHEAYADWLEAGARLGLALLVATFAAYVFDYVLFLCRIGAHCGCHRRLLAADVHSAAAAGR